MSKIILALIALVLMTNVALADRAEVMILPTRVVLENKVRFTTVVVKNTGNATGDFTLDLIDMEMKPDGLVVPYDDAGKSASPYSAQQYLRMAPKSMTLKPGESQNVRIMLRKPENMEDGEFRSHLQIRIVNDNVDQTAAEQKDAGISVKTNLVLVIPVIIRNGKTSYSVKMNDMKLIRQDGQPKISLSLEREGNRSSMGDFTVVYKSPSGESIPLKKYPGIPVYRPLAKRQVLIPLDELPNGVDLSKGQMSVSYSSQEQEGSQLLATGNFSLN